LIGKPKLKCGDANTIRWIWDIEAQRIDQSEAGKTFGASVVRCYFCTPLKKREGRSLDALCELVTIGIVENPDFIGRIF